MATFSYSYDTGQGLQKHKWDKPYASFADRKAWSEDRGKKGSVGKCPSTITPSLAQDLLNNGIALPDNIGGPDPKHIANQHEGVIYVAKPTLPGKSYHGFPWRGDQNFRPPIPRDILAQLEQRAKDSGYHEEFKQWMKQYGP